jgi:hypothetical protein
MISMMVPPTRSSMSVNPHEKARLGRFLIIFEMIFIILASPEDKIIG